MSVSIAVDCPNRRVTITWHVYADRSWRNGQPELQRLVREVRRFWNPTPALKYKRCEVRLEVDLLQWPNPGHRKAGYDLLMMDWLDASAQLDSPAGMGATNRTGEGPYTPDRYKEMTISFPDPVGDFDWNIPGHEVGHALGLSDPGPGQNWDETGLTDRNIEQIVSACSMYSADTGWSGWRRDLACCGAIGDARTERDPGD